MNDERLHESCAAEGRCRPAARATRPTVGRRGVAGDRPLGIGRLRCAGNVVERRALRGADELAARQKRGAKDRTRRAGSGPPCASTPSCRSTKTQNGWSGDPTTPSRDAPITLAADDRPDETGRLNVPLLSYGDESLVEEGRELLALGSTAPVTLMKTMFAPISLSKGSNDGASACMSATWSAGRPMPKVPDRYRYEPKNHHLSRASGPPSATSGWTSEAAFGASARNVVADPVLRRERHRRAARESVRARLGDHVRGDAHAEGRRGIEAARLELHVGDRVPEERRVPCPRVDRGSHISAIDQRRRRGDARAVHVEDGRLVHRCVPRNRAGREPQELRPVFLARRAGWPAAFPR